MESIRWDDVPVERLTALATRQILHTKTMTMARLKLLAGAVVRRHSHHNEQISTVMRGALRFEMGQQEFVVRAGETLVIPSDVPHAVIAEEDTEVTDVFSPRREDWIAGNDSYLR